MSIKTFVLIKVCFIIIVTHYTLDLYIFLYLLIESYEQFENRINIKYW